nr:unnamed protein product [Digitaria exilis]
MKSAQTGENDELTTFRHPIEIHTEVRKHHGRLSLALSLSRACTSSSESSVCRRSPPAASTA